MENIYIVFIECDNNVAKISPIKCSFTEIIQNSIKSLKSFKNIYFYSKSKISTIKSSDKLLGIIDSKNTEIYNKNIDSVIISLPTISFIIITPNKTQCYVISCDNNSYDILMTPINKNITNLISNLILNINHKKEKKETITLNEQQRQRPLQQPLQLQPRVLSTKPYVQQAAEIPARPMNAVTLKVVSAINPLNVAVTS
jgi:hypothetical protein